MCWGAADEPGAIPIPAPEVSEEEIRRYIEANKRLIRQHDWGPSEWARPSREEAIKSIREKDVIVVGWPSYDDW